MTQYSSHLFQILEAQRVNLCRLKKDLAVLETNGSQETRLLVGDPVPDVIRMFDRPERLFNDEAFKDLHTMLTILPLSDNPAGGRVVNRIDRQYTYQIFGAVMLTDEEAERDFKQDGESRLGCKVSNILSDIRGVFYDDLRLVVSGGNDCPLVDDSDMRVTFVPEVQWPQAMFVIDVFSAASGVTY